MPPEPKFEKGEHFRNGYDTNMYVKRRLYDVDEREILYEMRLPDLDDGRKDSTIATEWDLENALIHVSGDDEESSSW